MNLARALFTVGGLTLTSRILGFVRDMLLAIVLAAGPVADAFLVALRLPNLFRSLFAEGALSTAFVPLFTRLRQERGLMVAQGFMQQALAWLSTILLVLTALGLIFMPQLINILAPGFATNAIKFALAVEYGRITFIYLLLISLAALLGAALNAVGRFAPYAAAPILFNVVATVVLLLALHAGLDAGFWLSWSVTIAGMVQLLWMLVAARRAGLQVAFPWPRLSLEIRQLLRVMGPSAFGAGASQINVLVSTMIASQLATGAVSYLYYADRLNLLTVGVIGIALSTALLPLLSQKVAAGDVLGEQTTASRAIEIALAFSVPAAIALIVAGVPIIQTLFQHGNFSAFDTQQTAKTLAAFSLGLPAILLVKVWATPFFARGDTKTPVRLALLSIMANVGLSLWLQNYFSHTGIALANALANWLNAGLLLWQLRKQKLWSPDAIFKQRLPRLILANIFMALALWQFLPLLQGLYAAHHNIAHVLATSLLIGVGVVTYAASLLLLRAVRVAELRQAFVRRLPDKTDKTQA